MSAILVPNRLLPQMVGKSYYAEEEPPILRYSSRGHGYPLSHGRDLSSGSGHNVYSRPHPTNHDSRNRDRSPDRDELPRTRSRIPVACGRCRKRKIRCSGDNGTGGPCTSCKTAGATECAFLRVSSEVAQLKSETPAFDFESGSASSRHNCRMVPFGPSSYGSQGQPLGFDPYSYRNNSLSAYQYGQKQYYPVASYSDFGDEAVEYGLQIQQMQCMIPGDQMGLGSSYTPAPSRNWSSTPQLSKNLPFLESPTAVYTHGQSSYNGMTNFDLRSNITPDPKSIPLSGINQPHPTSVNTVLDRLLPFPAPVPANRPPPVNQYLPPAENILPTAHSRGSYIDCNAVQTLKTHNNTAVSENGSISNSSYLPVANQSPESISSQGTYSANAYSLPSSQAGVYTPPHSNDGLHTNEPSSSYSHSDCNSDSFYSHRNNGNEKRGSHSSQGGCDGLPPLTNGSLANGYRYDPAPSSLAPNQYSTPPIEIQPQPRRQSGVLA